tara:strand:+ start:175 stop:555 length:381 start_codon:yes stop_codon:yes gene_type:complete
MKKGFLRSILSCTLKCIRISVSMAKKKIFFSLFLLSLLGSCGAPTAMIGPAYTLSSSGNVIQASLSYGSNELVTMYTGKSPLENIKEISLNEEKNIQQKTLEGEDFYNLVKKRVEKTNAILNSSNQ